MTQYVPLGEDFTEPPGNPSGSTVFHGNYLRLLPWVGTETFTGYAIESGIGTLHSGYFGATRAFAGPYLLGGEIGLRGASFYAESSAGALKPDSLASTLYRRYWGANCTVSATFQLFEYSSGATNSTVTYLGLLARWSGTTLSEATAATFAGTTTTAMGRERHTGGNGYALLYMRNTSTPVWALVKFASGGTSIIAQENAGAGAALFWATARDVTMTVENVSGGVRILCSYTANSPLIPTHSRPDTHVLFNGYVNDLTVNGAITTPGRAGFCSMPARGGSTMLCHRFEITDLDSQSLQLSEEWYRGADGGLNIGYGTLADSNGVTGRNLLCRFQGDANAVRYNRQMAPGVSGTLGQCAYENHNSDAQPIMFADVLPAPSDTANIRRYKVSYPANNQTSTGGVFLRGHYDSSLGSPNYYLKNCYGCFLTFNKTAPNNTWSMGVIAYGPTGLPIGSVSASLTFVTSNPQYGITGIPPQDVTLELEAVNNTSGQPILYMRVNGVIVTTYTSIQTFQLQPDGGLLDPTASNPRASGTVDAFSGAWNTAGFNVYNDDWQQANPQSTDPIGVAHIIRQTVSSNTTEARVAYVTRQTVASNVSEGRVAYIVRQTVWGPTPSVDDIAIPVMFTLTVPAVAVSLVSSYAASSVFFQFRLPSVGSSQTVEPIKADPAGSVQVGGVQLYQVVPGGPQAGMVK